MTKSIRELHAHYEQVFGVARAVRGFDLGALSLDVAIFDDTPCEGASTFATAGLASKIGQEVLLSCHARQATAKTTYGTCGVKVWVFKGEIMAHDPMAQDRKAAEQAPQR